MTTKKMKIAKKPIDKQVELFWVPLVLFLANIAVLEFCYLWEAGHLLQGNVQLLLASASTLFLLLSLYYKKKNLLRFASLLFLLQSMVLFVS